VSSREGSERFGHEDHERVRSEVLTILWIVWARIGRRSRGCEVSVFRRLRPRRLRKESVDLASSDIPRERGREFGGSVSRVSESGKPSDWRREGRECDKEKSQ
jgi:hypothetical protein